MCRRGCGSGQGNWYIWKSLHLTARPAGDTAALEEACVDLDSEQSSCSESCDGDYRTFTGCCNNLLNTEHGQVVFIIERC